MKIVWDAPKRETNLVEHHLDFADAELCDWDAAVVRPSYPGKRGEPRFVAVLPFSDDLIAIVFTPLGSEAISVISMRPASRRERRLYAQA